MRCNLLLSFEHLLDVFTGITLGTFERSTKSTVPDELGGDTECTGDTKENSVEVHLVETIGRGCQSGSGCGNERRQKTDP